MKRFVAGLVTSLAYICSSPVWSLAAECIRTSDALEASQEYADCLAAELAAMRALMGDRVAALLLEIHALQAQVNRLDGALREEIKSARDAAIGASRVWNESGRSCNDGRVVTMLPGTIENGRGELICQKN